LLLSTSTSAQTYEEAKEQLTVLVACQQSLQHPDCNLDIIDSKICDLDVFISVCRELLLNKNAIEGVQYYIEVSNNDEFFIINGERYEAKTYCFNMRVGDPIIFIEGSAHGICVSAKLLNLRTDNECRVWCE